MQSETSCPFSTDTVSSGACPFANKRSSDFTSYQSKAVEMMAALPSVLDAKTLEVVNATAPAVVASIETITKTFYPRMFEIHPETKNYFNPAHQVISGDDGKKAAQPFALAHAIVRYVGHLNDPEGLRSAIELAAQKHCALGIKAEHYPIVYESFMWAVGQVLGAAVTTEVADAWGKVVLYIARALIERELEIYDTHEAKEFGWFGWKEFRVTEKRRNSDFVYTFAFEPVDGSKLPQYEAGQYITLRLHKVPGAHAETTLRHYSLVSPPGSTGFTISVQQEPGVNAPPGLVSNYLRDHVRVGDVIELAMPFGTFKLKPTEEKPVVLISGGIGCTVTMAMLDHVTKSRKFSKLYYIQSVRDGSVHPYRNKVTRVLSQNKEKVEGLIFYTKPRPQDKEGVDYNIPGRITFEHLEQFLKEDLKNSNFVLCGPEQLVSFVIAGLLERGVPRDAIQFECFGPLAISLEKYA